MKRILACTASDFGKPQTPNELKESIVASEGRTIIIDIAAERSPLYPEVTNAELIAAFGADLLLLKDIDVSKWQIGGLGEIDHLDEIRKLTGLGIGVNLEVSDTAPLYKRISEEALQAVLQKGPDFLSITAYLRPEATPARIVEDIRLTRRYYDGFLMLNPVVNHGMQLDSKTLRSYVEAGIDLLVLPCPGAVPGITENKLETVITELKQTGVLISCTMGTSQEGADKETVQQLALAAKRVGSDVVEMGDAGVAGMPVPENVYHVSNAIRGQRHTWVRMARSANR